MTRIGPKMALAIDIVRARNAADRPIVKAELARLVGPHGSNAFGDRIVQRCLKVGALRIEPSARVHHNAKGELIAS